MLSTEVSHHRLHIWLHSPNRARISICRETRSSSCTRDMRTRVTDVLDSLDGAANFEEILQDFPYLERRDIIAAYHGSFHSTIAVNPLCMCLFY